MDALELDPALGLLFGSFTRDEGSQANCSDVAGAHTFVVAVARTALPTGHLTVRLERDFTVCLDCGRDSEEVEIDL